MEMEVRQQKIVEVIVALHVTLGRRVDLLAVERLQIGYPSIDVSDATIQRLWQPLPAEP
jgi:hypothetical protein